MTPEELLQLAKQIIKMNTIFDFSLSGSLMLHNRGIKTRREPTDIDLVGFFESAGDIIMPADYEIIETDTTSGYIDAVTFQNKNTLQKVDFLYNTNEENFEQINGVDCTFVEYMVEAKLLYIKNDSSMESKTKHYEDLVFIQDQLTPYQKEQLYKFKI